MKIKICGITNLDDARIATEAGADYLGFIMHQPSPRSTTVQDAAQIIQHIRAEFGDHAPLMVGVFVNEAVSAVTLKMAETGFNFAQLSGDESPEALKELFGKAYKAIRPQTLQFAELDVKDYAPFGIKKPEHPAILVDAHDPKLYGGTGQLADLQIVQQITAMEPRMMLAGGLNPDNIAEIVRTVQPFAIDVASGVEAQPGKKDPDKVRAFISAARHAANQL